MYSSNAQPTGTNRPRACLQTLNTTPQTVAVRDTTRSRPLHRSHPQSPTNTPLSLRTTNSTLGTPTSTRGCVCSARVTAAIAKGKHPVPSRTRKLSLSAPMVLQPRGCGRVGRRRTYTSVEATVQVASTAFQRPIPYDTQEQQPWPSNAAPSVRRGRSDRRSQRRRQVHGGKPRRRQAAGGKPAAASPLPAASRTSAKSGERSRGGRPTTAGRQAVAQHGGRRRRKRPARSTGRAAATGSAPATSRPTRTADQARLRRPGAPRGGHRRRARPRHQPPSSRVCPRSWPPAWPGTWPPPACSSTSDPETAYQHTLAARARAPRLAVVREATGEAAYAAGHYAEALAELRAAKRMNGATAYLPIMADCHRALGKPQQALKLAKSPSVANFAPEAEGRDDDRRGRRPSRPGPARRRAAHPRARAADVEEPRALGRPAALRLRRHPRGRRPRAGRARLVPPHPRDRHRPAHRRRRARRGAGERSVGEV